MNFITFVGNELLLDKSLSKTHREILRKLCNIFSNQGHSGISAKITSMIFTNYVKDNIDKIKKEWFTEEGDFYGGLSGLCLQELAEALKSFNLNKKDKDFILKKFSLLTQYKPLTPLTFRDDEWVEIIPGYFQNRRNPAVFKEEKSGKPYYINAYYMKNQWGGTYTGSLDTPKGKIRRCYIKDSKNMPTIYIDIVEREVNKDNPDIDEPGSGWWITEMKDSNQLKELEKFYELEYF